MDFRRHKFLKEYLLFLSIQITKSTNCVDVECITYTIYSRSSSIHTEKKQITKTSHNAGITTSTAKISVENLATIRPLI